MKNMENSLIDKIYSSFAATHFLGFLLASKLNIWKEFGDVYLLGTNAVNSIYISDFSIRILFKSI